jgi:hypothetical protein
MPNGGIAHHPAFADVPAAGLELRLDESHKPGILGGERQRRRQYRREANKARIASDHVDRLWDLDSGEIAGIQPLVNNDAWILPQFPGELAMTDVDGINARGAARQQHVGEAACRSADIEGCPPLNVDPEMVQGMKKLDPATRHPGMVVPLD